MLAVGAEGGLCEERLGCSWMQLEPTHPLQGTAEPMAETEARQGKHMEERSEGKNTRNSSVSTIVVVMKQEEHPAAGRV